MLVKLYVFKFKKKHVLFEQSNDTCDISIYFDEQVAILSECTDDVADIAFQYGRNVGIAFQVRMIFYIRNNYQERLI